MTGPSEAPSSALRTGASEGKPPVIAILGSALLVSRLADADAVAATVDSLLLAQPDTPTSGAFPTWAQTFGEVLIDLGWLSLDVNSVRLGDSAFAAGKPSQPSQSPWPGIAVKLPVPVAAALTPAVGALARLPAPQRDQWNSQTAFTSSAIAVFAVAESAGTTTQLTVATSWLTYRSEPAGTIAVYPTAPVPVRNAEVTVESTVYQIETATLAGLRPKLDPPVNPVRGSIIWLPSL